MTAEPKIHKRTKVRRYKQGVDAFKTDAPSQCPFDHACYWWYLGYYDEQIRTNLASFFRKHDFYYSNYDMI